MVCLGGDTAGWSFYIMDGKLVYHYNWFAMERYEAVSDVAVPAGKVEKQVRGRFSVETLDVSVDALTPVSNAYEHKRPFWFTGTIHCVTFNVSGDVVEDSEAAMRRILARQ